MLERILTVMMVNLIQVRERTLIETAMENLVVVERRVQVVLHLLVVVEVMLI